MADSALLLWVTGKRSPALRLASFCGSWVESDPHYSLRRAVVLCTSIGYFQWFQHVGRCVLLCRIHPLVTSSGFSTLVVYILWKYILYAIVCSCAVYIHWLLPLVSARLFACSGAVYIHWLLPVVSARWSPCVVVPYTSIGYFQWFQHASCLHPMEIDRVQLCCVHPLVTSSGVGTFVRVQWCWVHPLVTSSGFSTL